MNRIWSRRSSATSCGCGSLTLTISSAAAKTSAARRQDAGAGRLVGAVVKADPGAGAALDDDLVAVMHQLAHAAGNEPDAVFVGFYLFRDADQHNPPPLGRRGPVSRAARLGPAATGWRKIWGYTVRL